MLKTILAIVLIFLLLFQSFEKISIYIYFSTYQKYIAEYLCVNRENKSLNCNGKCYLMKKMKNSEERTKTPIVPDNKKSDFIVSQSILNAVLAGKSFSKEKSFLISCYGINHISDIFHPPKC